jgi:hypothetical protein
MDAGDVLVGLVLWEGDCLAEEAEATVRSDVADHFDPASGNRLGGLTRQSAAYSLDP